MGALMQRPLLRVLELRRLQPKHVLMHLHLLHLLSLLRLWWGGGG